MSEAKKHPALRGDLFVGTLKFRNLVRLQIEGGRTTRRTHGRGERVRDVRQGPDGLSYLVTDSPEGKLLRWVS